MRQRGALARTLLSAARAWLLDEPFGALDALTRADLQGVLGATWAERRPTALLVTHDLDEALLIGDRVLVAGPRPMRIVDEIAVDLPRPRSLDDTLGPEFAALRARLMGALRGVGGPGVSTARAPRHRGRRAGGAAAPLAAAGRAGCRCCSSPSSRCWRGRS